MLSDPDFATPQLPSLPSVALPVGRRLRQRPRPDGACERGEGRDSTSIIVNPRRLNYLELFSSANQGLLHEKLPFKYSITPVGTYQFRSARLGAEFLAAGCTFAGSCEELESVGSPDRAAFRRNSASQDRIASGMTPVISILNSEWAYEGVRDAVFSPNSTRSTLGLVTFVS